MTLTYLYCLVRSDRRPSRRGMPAPLPGMGAPRAIDGGDGLWLIASDAPARLYDEAALSRGLPNLEWVAPRAMAHEAVVEHFLRQPAVLPMKLFTLFTTDERARAHVARRRARLDRALTRLERQHEWGLRLVLDAGGTSAAPAPSRRAESGTSYLARKRDQIGGSRAQLARARTGANRLFRAMAREATASLRRPETERAAKTSRLLVDAAFLVPAGGIGAFRAALRRQARLLGDSGVSVSLTGPWPPYHFVNAPGRSRRS